MSRVWIRGRPRTRDSALAGLVALGAGALAAGATFYVTRLMLAREPLELSPDSSDARQGGRHEDTESPR